MTKAAGRRAARFGPADEARPIEPPKAQNTCTHANIAHQSAAPLAATFPRPKHRQA